MPQIDFLTAFLQGNPPKKIRIIAAKGMAPLPPDRMLMLLVHLVKDPDPEVAAQAGSTLSEWPEMDVVAQLQNRECPASVLEHFAAAAASEAVQEAVILNPGTPGPAVALLSSHVPARLLESVLYNRVRLLDHPDILAGVKRNPAVTPEIARIVQEIEADFFGERKKDYLVDSAEEETSPAIEEGPLPEEELPPFDLALEGLPLDPQEREAALQQRLGNMSVRDKIRYAMLGPREARTVLIRDTNRQVARSVLQSPKLTENEVESFAAMRNVSDEILREIGNSRAWTRSYAVVQNLVRNPKTPPAISQRMLFRLHNKDLMVLSRDRGIPEAVRRNAGRTLSSRNGR